MKKKNVEKGKLREGTRPKIFGTKEKRSNREKEKRKRERKEKGKREKREKKKKRK